MVRVALHSVLSLKGFISVAVMWPLRVFFFGVLLLISANAFEQFQPRSEYYRRSGPEIYGEEIRPLMKRQSEVKREALARARCFFNPITC
ncbi:hypothetical protein GCK32_010017 [Trichostrongylus colubriformis]|uniref:Uncharacterized protein n=1 Tax=Trichostrongylus colubriformis TaxID=6319 RepID=A0AAN8FBR8_TRICO